MKAGKQLGADMMTERVIRELTKKKQSLAEPEPINAANWDEAIMTELGHTNDDITPTDLQPQLNTMDTYGHLDKQPNDTGLPIPAHPRPSQAQKTKAHNKTPQKPPTKTTPPPKKNKATPASPQPNQKTDGTAAFTSHTKHKEIGKRPSENPQGKGKK